MPELLLSSAEYTGYISIIKFLVFLLLFFLWLPIIGWVYNDAKAVGTKEVMWTAVILATGAVAVIIFLFIPVGENGINRLQRAFPGEGVPVFRPEGIGFAIVLPNTCPQPKTAVYYPDTGSWAVQC